ncbi:MAG TPA: DNA polymerase/3'-5' exonuclease PolX [Thermodesulfobacteriota bacterium]|nr:DNA polymerase/3'-5' exonuclease PolX [Thermodesulfobacteriota bacterium]
MENKTIADIFTEIADILEIQGENPFRVRSYRNAARTIVDMSRSLESLVKAGEDLEEIPGIGKSMSEKIQEILSTGKCHTLEELRSRVPPGLTELLKLEGLGPKKVKALYDELSVDSVDRLEKAAQAGRLRNLPGMGLKTEEKVLKSIEHYRAGMGRFKLSVGFQYAEALLRHLKGVPGVKRLDPAGSFRRRRETIGDLDILAICGKGCKVMDRFAGYGDVAEVLAKGDTKSSVRLKCGLQVDLRVLEEESYGAALHYFTGSKAHNVTLRERAKEKGLKVSEYGVFRAKDEKRLSGAEEEDVFTAVGLPLIPPELREDRGEVQAAEKGTLPRLIDLSDVRGDLQMHTTASDGKNSILEMAQKAKDTGYAYIAITDHSKAVRVAGGMDEKQLAKHLREIEKANRQISGLRILKGVEVDILPDGTLDLKDDILRECEVVLASVHSRFNMEEGEMTRRVIKAIQNPNVKILAHPTGRLILEREPFKINLGEVIRAAVDHGVVLEINAYPDRLDLKDVDARMARDLGAKLAINTDAHSALQLELMKFGVFTARRGWIEAKDVINTLPLERLLKALR